MTKGRIDNASNSKAHKLFQSNSLHLRDSRYSTSRFYDLFTPNRAARNEIGHYEPSPTYLERIWQLPKLDVLRNHDRSALDVDSGLEPCRHFYHENKCDKKQRRPISTEKYRIDPLEPLAMSTSGGNSGGLTREKESHARTNSAAGGPKTATSTTGASLPIVSHLLRSSSAADASVTPVLEIREEPTSSSISYSSHSCSSSPLSSSPPSTSPTNSHESSTLYGCDSFTQHRANDGRLNNNNNCGHSGGCPTFCCSGSLVCFTHTDQDRVLIGQDRRLDTTTTTTTGTVNTMASSSTSHPRKYSLQSSVSALYLHAIGAGDVDGLPKSPLVGAVGQQPTPSRNDNIDFWAGTPSIYSGQSNLGMRRFSSISAESSSAAANGDNMPISNDLPIGARGNNPSMNHRTLAQQAFLFGAANECAIADEPSSPRQNGQSLFSSSLSLDEAAMSSGHSAFDAPRKSSFHNSFSGGVKNPLNDIWSSPSSQVSLHPPSSLKANSSDNLNELNENFSPRLKNTLFPSTSSTSSAVDMPGSLNLHGARSTNSSSNSLSAAGHSFNDGYAHNEAQLAQKLRSLTVAYSTNGMERTQPPIGSGIGGRRMLRPYDSDNNQFADSSQFSLNSVSSTNSSSQMRPPPPPPIGSSASTTPIMSHADLSTPRAVQNADFSSIMHEQYRAAPISPFGPLRRVSSNGEQSVMLDSDVQMSKASAEALKAGLASKKAKKPRSSKKSPTSKVNRLKETQWNDRQLSDIFGSVFEHSKDQFGSRFIQEKLETATDGEKDIILQEIVPSSYILMNDVFGNYVVQKLMEYGNDSQRRALLDIMSGHIFSLAMHMYGCRIVQRALDCVSIDDQTVIIEELRGHVIECVKDQNANHVIQKAIERVPFDYMNFIVADFKHLMFPLATHPYGCRVIQRLLEYSDNSNRKGLMAQLDPFIFFMTIDQYGNYVVQHILQRGPINDREHALQTVERHLIEFSKHKYASNVVETAIRVANDVQRQRLIDIILAPEIGTKIAMPSVSFTDLNGELRVLSESDIGSWNSNGRKDGGGIRSQAKTPLEDLMRDKFGNYVIQKLLECAISHQRDLLVNRIRPLAIELRKTISGKHLQSVCEAVGL